MDKPPTSETTTRLSEEEPPSTTQVGTEIRGWCGRRRLSLTALCKQVGMERRTFDRKLNGTSPITLEELSTICQALDVPAYVVLENAERNKAYTA